MTSYKLRKMPPYLQPTAMFSYKFELMIILQVLRWNYSYTTLGHKQFSQTFLFECSEKKWLKFNIMSNFLVFFLFTHLADLVLKTSLQNFICLYLGQMCKMGAMELTTGGPDTDDAPHETGATRTAARHLLVQKNNFRNYQKLLNFWLL